MNTCLRAGMPVCFGPYPVPASVCVVLVRALCACVPCTLLRVLSLCLRVGFVSHLVDIVVSFPVPYLVVVHRGSPIVSRSS